LVIYVDDLIAESAFVSRIKQQMKLRSNMHDLGLADFYLGMKIEGGPGYIDLSLSAFIDTLLHRFGMQDAKLVRTPMDLRLRI
jgi:hypothetical protein